MPKVHIIYNRSKRQQKKEKAIRRGAKDNERGDVGNKREKTNNG